MLDADIRDYFGSIDHEKLMKLVAKWLSDRRVLKLVRQWLEAGVMGDGRRGGLAEHRGSAQGGVISPFLSNVYLHVIDVMWQRDGAQSGMLVCYGDDLVVMTATRKACEQPKSA